MAASTTSLPEDLGGAELGLPVHLDQDSRPRLRSLHRVGFDWEAIEYWGFVLEESAG